MCLCVKLKAAFKLDLKLNLLILALNKLATAFDTFDTFFTLITFLFFIYLLRSTPLGKKNSGGESNINYNP